MGAARLREVSRAIISWLPGAFAPRHVCASPPYVIRRCAGANETLGPWSTRVGPELRSRPKMVPGNGQDQAWIEDATRGDSRGNSPSTDGAGPQQTSLAWRRGNTRGRLRGLLAETSGRPPFVRKSGNQEAPRQQEVPASTGQDQPELHRSTRTRNPIKRLQV